ncbi:MAG: hypothetical protein ACI4N3_00915 [Alphaproteobacteria bacterium]
MNEDCFNIAGFTKYPTDISCCIPRMGLAQWLKGCNIPDALIYYGLDSDVEFMKLFDDVWQRVLQSDELQYVIYSISNYLFDNDKLPLWHKFERDVIDMLPAVIILSGWKRHIRNMENKKFDINQIEFNKEELKNTLTKGMRVYGKSGMLISQMIWASILLNANLVKLGCLQYETKIADDKHLCDKISIGDTIVAIHIPNRALFTSDVVEKSIKMARKYFGLKMQFICDSWLLGKQLGNYIKADSNIAGFRRYFRIIKRGNSESVYNFLFNNADDNPNISDLSEETSLQKSVKRAMLSGVHFYDAIGIIDF